MKIRLLFALCVVIASALCGWSVAKGAKQHCDQLAEIIRAVRSLRVQILALAEPVSRALRNTEYSLFLSTAEKMGSQASADEAWKEVVTAADMKSRILLSEAEQNCVERMLHRLGSSRRETQDEVISNCCSQLEGLLSDAQEREHKTSRLYTSLGFLLGMCAAILIL